MGMLYAPWEGMNVSRLGWLPFFLFFVLPVQALIGHSAGHRLVWGLGGHDFKRQDPGALETRVELRFDRKDVLKPLLGFSATTKGSLYGYVGLYYDWAFAQKWVLTPSIAVGAYNRFEGKDLGHWFELRSQIELAYVLASGLRLSVGLAHTSNARLAQLENEGKNPGCEHLFFGISIPLK